jgi:hypothetical protein
MHDHQPSPAGVGTTTCDGRTNFEHLRLDPRCLVRLPDKNAGQRPSSTNEAGQAPDAGRAISVAILSIADESQFPFRNRSFREIDMRRMMLIAIMCIGCGAGDDDHEPLRERTTCERLRDHLIELRLADATGVDRDAHREALRQAIGPNVVSSCEPRSTGTTARASASRS